GLAGRRPCRACREGRRHRPCGIGSDYDGISGTHPDGMEGVDKYPALFAELARRGWSDADLAKLSGGNFLRALEGAERVAASLKDRLPFNGTIEALDGH